jgi:hypothetical protein
VALLRRIASYGMRAPDFACLSCCSLRSVEENNRVERQDVGGVILVAYT